VRSRGRQAALDESGHFECPVGQRLRDSAARVLLPVPVDIQPEIDHVIQVREPAGSLKAVRGLALRPRRRVLFGEAG
jgi:hypothetical protein